MNTIVKAELLRLMRRRTMAVAAGASVLFALVAVLAVFSSARTSGPSRTRQGGTTLAVLAGRGGGTQAFAVGAAFAGFLIFVTVIALIAGEFSGGTFRALLLRDPHRLRLIVGKLAGFLIAAAAVIALAEVCTVALSLIVAPTKDIATGGWFSLAGLGAGLRDYVTVLAGVTGWAVFGTTLAVVLRSVPLALGAGFAWAGPFENIVVDSWSGGNRFFPGQVLRALIEGGTAELGMGRALLTAAIYTGAAAGIGLFLVSRRDVTA